MSANLRGVKPSELPTLTGITIDLDVEDKRLRGMTLTDAEGRSLTIRHRDYSGLHLLVPVPMVEVERFRLHGKIAELVIDQTFDTKREAEIAREAIEASDVLEIETVKVSLPAPVEVS